VLPLQTWAALKNFFHEAFTRHLDAISMHPTAGQHGYSNPNPYAIFNTTHDDNDTSTVSTHHTIATTTVPTIGSMHGGSTMSPEVASALAQISHTQNALMLQMAALSVVPPQQPPNQITTPNGNQFTRGGGYREQGGVGYRGQQGGTYGGQGMGGCKWGRGRGAFVQAAQNNNIPPVGGQITPLFSGGTGMPTAPNPVKSFNNWNYCFSCGFDVEDGHKSTTCPRDWRKAGHQEGCTRNNVQQYIAAGHASSLKGKLKNQLPAFF
jgi:hypothetical protein